MSDQAQGLRALADQARREQSSPIVSPAPHRDAPADTLGTSAATLPFARPEREVAAVDARMLAPSAREIATRGRARVVAITSGKGGVGKTNFSSNLALTLSQSGQRVIVFDADLGLANLHVVLGVSPRFHLEHVMRGEK